MTKKRAQMMEIFMDLDKNHDNFVDRKDLIKYYGMLSQIKGASVTPQYKCKQGHKMEIIEHNMNFEVNEKVKLNFNQSVENRQSGFIEYNGKKATIIGEYNDNSKVQSCKTEDDQTHYFPIQNYGKLDSPIHPGEKVKCCHDKECEDKPEKNKDNLFMAGK